MELKFKPTAEKDLAIWHRKRDKIALNKIEKILKELKANPCIGTGNPEALKYNLSGYWSRRINSKHRVLYTIDEENQVVTIHSLLGHYYDK